MSTAVQPLYRMAVIACDECQADIASGDLTEKDVQAAYVWRFERVTAFGHMEVWRWASKKNHGKLLAIEPYASESPFNWQRMLVQHNANSPFFQSFQSRAWMKDQLGRKWARLVNRARKSTKQEWLAALSGGSIVCQIRSFHSSPGIKLPVTSEWDEAKGTYKVHVEAEPSLAGAIAAIRGRLQMEPDQFWRYAKGTHVIPSDLMRNNRPYQLELFDTNAE